MAATTAVQANKALVQRLYEGINEKNDDELLECYASDCVVHSGPGIEESTGREGVLQQFQVTRAAFPDIDASIEAIVAEDDLVTARIAYTGTHEGEFLGVPATGKDVSFNGTNVFRIEDGEISEVWPMVDTLGVLQQFGVSELPSK